MRAATKPNAEAAKAKATGAGAGTALTKDVEWVSVLTPTVINPPSRKAASNTVGKGAVLKLKPISAFKPAFGAKLSSMLFAVKAVRSPKPTLNPAWSPAVVVQLNPVKSPSPTDPVVKLVENQPTPEVRLETSSPNVLNANVYAFTAPNPKNGVSNSNPKIFLTILILLTKNANPEP